MSLLNRLPISSRRFFRRSRRATSHHRSPGASTFIALEQLEPRLMLSADLVIFDMYFAYNGLSARTVAPGEQITVSAMTRNQGTAATVITGNQFETQDHFDSTLYLWEQNTYDELEFPLYPGGTPNPPFGHSDDWQFMSDEYECGDIPFDVLNASQFSDDSLTFSAPTTPGVYILRMIADDHAQVQEDSESNNWSSVLTLTVTEGIPTVQGADLIVSNTRFASTGNQAMTAAPGQAFNVYVTTTNQGDAAAYPNWNIYFDTALYRRTDQNFYLDDEVHNVGELSYDWLAAGASRQGTISLTAPTTPGTYYYAAGADDWYNVDESNESNNISDVLTLIVDPSANDLNLELTSPATPQHVKQGDWVPLRWDDGDPQDGSAVVWAYDVDLDSTPWKSPGAAKEIKTLPAQDTTNTWQWDTANVEPGTYSLWAMLYNADQRVTKRAAGTVTISSPFYTLDGSNLTVHGTRDNDNIEFWLGSGNGQHKLRVNGHAFQFDPTVRNIDIQADEGTDTVCVYGTSAHEEATFWGSENVSRLVSGRRTVYAQHAEKHYFHGEGGTDSATFKDSGGNDTWIVKANGSQSTLLTAGGEKYVGIGFDQSTSYSQYGGNDCLVLFGSSGNDVLTCRGNSGQIELQTPYNDTNTTYVGIGYAKAHAFARGGKDTVHFYDSQGKDRVACDAEKRKSAMGTEDGALYSAYNFEEVKAFSQNGQDSFVWYDSSGNDLMTTKGNDEKSMFLSSRGDRYVGTGFTTTSAISRNGNDTLKLYDTAGDDLFRSKADNAQSTLLTSGGQKYQGYGFNRTYAYGSAGGVDTALFHDTSGNDLFRADAKYSQSSIFDGERKWVSIGFDKTNAYSENGGVDSLIFYDSRGIDDFTNFARNGESILLASDNKTYAGFGFVNNTAYSLYGNDRLELRDSSADGNLEAHLGNDWITYEAGGYYFENRGFDAFEAQSDSGRSTALLYDSAGDDLLNVDAENREVTLEGNGKRYVLHQFEHVIAHAKMGGADTAVFYDSRADDEFTVRGDQYSAAINTSTDSYLSAEFETNHAFSTRGGDDTSKYYDSSRNDLFRAIPDEDQAKFSSGYSQVFCTYGFVKNEAFSMNGSDLLEFKNSTGDDLFYVDANRQVAEFNELDTGRQWIGYGFATNTAYSDYGQNDSAYFYDSAGDDTFYSNNHLVKVYNDTNLYQSLLYSENFAYSQNGGNDTVQRNNPASGDNYLYGWS